MEIISSSGENDLNNYKKNNNKKNILLVIVSIMVFIFVVVAIVCSIGNNSSTSSSSSVKFEENNVTMETSFSEYLGWSCTISGIITNVSKKDYSYVSVSYSVYNSSGVKIGTAYDNISGLLSGESWSFEAAMFDYPSTEPVSYKLTDITYF